MNILPVCFVLLVLATTMWGSAAFLGVEVDCDPCIDRESFKVKVIAHGTEGDDFWQGVRQAAMQAGSDMRVELEFDLYESYSDRQMAKDIIDVAELAAKKDPRAPDALVVTIPSEEVEVAIRYATEYIPIFGMNSGYDRAEIVGTLGFVAMDEYLGGAHAAKEFLATKNVTRTLFVNHAYGNTALQARYDGLFDTLRDANAQVEVEELVIDLTASDSVNKFDSVLNGCTYDAILLGGMATLDMFIEAMAGNECDYSSTLVGSFDTSKEAFDAIAVGKLEFAISQQAYLQGALSVALAAVYVTTGKKLARSSESEFGIYFSGPKILNFENLPSDTLQSCEAEAFPVCGGSTPFSGVNRECPCTDRSKIRIAGVLHGVTTDAFWDVVFDQANQAADDLGVDLLLDRLEPQPSVETWHAKMASKMISLCREGVDSLFVTIPSDDVVAAIQECEMLNVPVVSVNSGASTAQSIGLKHHISQLEYSAGNEAGKRLEENGMTHAACLIYEAGNDGVQQRCAGFAEAVAASESVTDLGIILVPRDSDIAAIKAIEDAVGQDGDWEGVGILNNGEDTVTAIVELKKSHPKLLAGTFDLSDKIYDGLDEGVFLFAIDQNPFVQGYIPIWLLTLMASTKQHLLNTFIESGPSFIETSPSDSLQKCTQNNFEVCPRPVEIIYEDNLLNTGILLFGYVVVGISWSLALCFLVWIFRNRNRNIVEASQPEFLVLICVGAIISSSTLVALSFQAGTGDDTTLADLGCMAAPFLYTVGWVFMFGSLCTKTYRMFKIMQNVKEDKQQIVSFRSMLMVLVMAMIVDMVIAITWTTQNPMEYIRDEQSRTVNSETGAITVNSVAQCANRYDDRPGFALYAGLLAGFHLILLVATNVFLYRVRGMKDRYQESKYIGFAMLLMSETLVVGLPIGVAVGDAQSLHVVLVGIIGVHDICVTSLLFFPKILFQSSIEEDELNHKEDAVILASLRKVSTSKFGEAMDILDQVSAPDTDYNLSDSQRAQLRLVKTLLLQRNHDQLMHVPAVLVKNRDGNDFILKEFGGVTGSDRFETTSINSKDSEVFPLDDDHTDYYTPPEFLNLPDEQRRTVYHLLSWANLKRWDFSVFQLMNLTDGNPLLLVGWAILGSPYSQYSMAQLCGHSDITLDDLEGYYFTESSLKVPMKKLCDYLRAVQSDYKEANPYHNAIHASDILQTVHSMIQMKERRFTHDEELFSILLAAVVHDVEHPGKNNTYQVNAKTPVALVYNDISVLENKHAAHAFMLMLRGQDTDNGDDLNLLCNVKSSKFASIRKRILEGVLSTDMTKHFERVDAVRGLLEDGGVDGIAGLNEKDRWDVLVYLLHVADISSQAKGSPIFKKWTDRCFQEFFLQGDDELRLGLPVSPNCDRRTTDIAESQIGFIQFVVKPAFEVLAGAIPELRQVALPQIERNLNFWSVRKGMGVGSKGNECWEEQALPPPTHNVTDVEDDWRDPLEEVVSNAVNRITASRARS